MSHVRISRIGRLMTWCATIAAFGAGFILTCAVIQHFLPFPEVPVVQTKLAHFAAHRNDYDTLFIGSSHFYFQFIPSVFDHAMAAGGQPTRTFNAGIAALRAPEDSYLLERFLALSPKRLRHVFIELAVLRTELDNVESRRAVYWHDATRMGMIWRAAAMKLQKKDLRAGFAALRDRASDLLVHLVLFLRQEANVGRGDVITARFGVSRQAQSAKDLGPALDGFMPANLPQTMPGEMRARYAAELENRRREPARKYRGDPVSQEVVLGMVGAVQKAGAIPVLVVPPTMDKKNFQPFPDGQFIVLDFCDVEKFPDLFEARNRLDLSHLNTAGGAIFSRVLAERFLEELARRRR